MARTYKLDHFTKGTGANVAPIDEDAKTPEERPGVSSVRVPAERRAAPEGERRTVRTPLPPGHVRKRATGEIGRVRSVDPRAGTAVVQWLHSGRTSTVPIASITRR